MEDEARDVLRVALSTEPSRPSSLVAAIRARIEPLGGISLKLPEREAIRNTKDVTDCGIELINPWNTAKT